MDRVDCVGFFNSTVDNGTIVAEPRVVREIGKLFEEARSSDVLFCVMELTLLPFGCHTQWENVFFNFDSVGEGMLTLFTVATLEGEPY